MASLQKVFETNTSGCEITEYDNNITAQHLTKQFKMVLYPKGEYDHVSDSFTPKLFVHYVSCDGRFNEVELPEYVEDSTMAISSDVWSMKQFSKPKFIPAIV